LGIGDWGLGPIPNPQSPIPNPHFRYIFLMIIKILINIKLYYSINQNKFFGLILKIDFFK